MWQPWDLGYTVHLALWTHREAFQTVSVGIKHVTHVTGTYALGVAVTGNHLATSELFTVSHNLFFFPQKCFIVGEPTANSLILCFKYPVYFISSLFQSEHTTFWKSVGFRLVHLHLPVRKAYKKSKSLKVTLVLSVHRLNEQCRILKIIPLNL